MTVPLRDKACRPAPDGVRALADEIRNRHGDAVQAVLFYGSCLRSGDPTDGLVDLYVLVDSYRRAYDSSVQAMLNYLLPPNVFYLEIPWQGRTIRSKYAVLSLGDFERGTTRWFHSYLWGRFAQPVGVVYLRDAAGEARVLAALARSIVTFVGHVLPALPQTFTTEELWREGFALTYRAELRPERPDRAAQLFAANADHYQTLTEAVFKSGYRDPKEAAVQRLPTGGYRFAPPGARRTRARLGWAVRCAQGKVLSVLRLAKASCTFRGGVDYILWKIERHSGVRAEVPPALRRWPLLAAGVLAWRLYVRGGFR